MQNWALELQDIPEGSRTLSTTMILRIFTEKFTHWGWWLLDMDLSVCSSSHALICRKFSEPWSRLAYQHTISCCCSVSRSCLTLCDLVDCSTLGFPVLRYLLEFAQTHVHWVTDAIQPSHPLLLPSPTALNLSQLQGLFQWFGSSHQAAKGLKFQFQHQSFQWIFKADFL